MSLSKLRFILFITIILTVASCKQTKSIVSQETVVEQLENALLWEISGNDLNQNSYLFGTIHIISEADYFIPKGTLSAIDNTEKIVFEINMEEMEDMSKLMSILGGVMMNNGTTLQDLVTPEDYKLIKDHFEQMGLPMFFFDKMKPMFLTVFSSGDVKPGDLETGAIKSYESELLSMGKKSNKEFGGLETVEYQISVFDSIPYTDQAEMLVESIKSANTDDDQFKEMIRIYKAQDLNAMQEMFAAEEGGIGDHEDVLLVNRNKNWIPIMETMMKEKPTFFAVGAGHLGGSFGVIKLLKEAGYKLKPISHTP
jgi:uncharacterized protein YbaP (TraB family)